MPELVDAQYTINQAWKSDKDTLGELLWVYNVFFVVCFGSSLYNGPKSNSLSPSKTPPRSRDKPIFTSHFIHFHFTFSLISTILFLSHLPHLLFTLCFSFSWMIAPSPSPQVGYTVTTFCIIILCNAYSSFSM
jgi:hypothetical protein